LTHLHRTRRPAKRPTRQPGPLWPIRKGRQERLRQLVQIAITRDFFDDIKQAAGSSGISVATLRRVLQGKGKGQMQFETYDGLYRLVGPDAADEFHALFMPPGAPETIGQGYSQWIRKNLQQSSRGIGRWWLKGPRGFFDRSIFMDDGGPTLRDRERDELWDHVMKKWPSLVKRLGQAYPDVIDLELREIARRRVLDLLIDGPESGYVIPSWRELPPKRVRNIIALGIQREEAIALLFRFPMTRMALAMDMSVRDFRAVHSPKCVSMPHGV
jgi:hypothetical protein